MNFLPLQRAASGRKSREPFFSDTDSLPLV
jgi:hypothetical protein